MGDSSTNRIKEELYFSGKVQQRVTASDSDYCLVFMP
jgi:hypothetical protein